MASRVFLTFLWHMHQPYYKDPETGVYSMPWVRLHGVKDYYGMVAILEEFPLVHQTFNLVPSLLEQIRDYTENNALDRVIELTLKPAKDLNEQEKIEILSRFFRLNRENMIFPYPRYYELFLSGGRGQANNSIPQGFTERDWRDLQVWYNLIWISPLYRNPDIQPFFEKGSNFSEKDKAHLLELHTEILKSIIPLYRDFAKKGQIELTTSPFYHPILPLLQDTDVAKESLPSTELPQNRFRHPEDAEFQISEGLRYFLDVFGITPSGMWPSEGSVSQNIAEMISKHDVEWIATDEAILSRSIGEDLSNDIKQRVKLLYKPYKLRFGERELCVIFRDNVLSDLIGFVYHSWSENRASRDMVSKLKVIRDTAEELGIDSILVPIVMDGENCWEFYRNNGIEFLRKLYEAIGNEEWISAVSVGEYLRNQSVSFGEIKYLHPGSWINANFRIWIGHSEDNKAWDELYKARELVGERFQERSDIWDAVRKELMIAEGSDWCWWYGDEHSSEESGEFDRLFRSRLGHIYELLELDVPDSLSRSIRGEEAVNLPLIYPIGLISPTVDGKQTHFYEWHEAGFFDVLKSGSSIHRLKTLMSGIHFGNNTDNLFIRVDFSPTLSSVDWEKGFRLELELSEPYRKKLVVRLSDYRVLDFSYLDYLNNIWTENQETSPQIAFADALEFSLPFLLPITDIQIVAFKISAFSESQLLETWPQDSSISFSPKERFYDWIV